jgi:hypothetical protein
VDPNQQDLILSLEQVPGIRSIRLNEQEMPQVSPDRSSYEIPLDNSTDRIVLVLEVEPRLAREFTEGATPEWGCIALIVRSRVDGQNSRESS